MDIAAIHISNDADTTHNSIKKINYLGISLMKNVQDAFTENYKTLPRETEKDLNEWRYMPYP